jgi:hypothetical protein
MPSRPFSRFVDACRMTVEPVAHLTDEQLAASTDLPPPLVTFLLNMRASLRQYEQADAQARTLQ